MNSRRMLGLSTLVLLSPAAMAAEYTAEEVWSASGSDTQTGFGYALAVGDFNGDALHDLAVGSSSSCTDETQIKGCVEVFLGTADSFESTPAWSVSGDTTTFAGRRLSAGDVNNDGFDDLLITPGADADSELYLGGTELFASEPAWTWMSSADFLPEGVIVGEMDGDDFLEIAVSDGASQTVEIFSGTLEAVTADYSITNTDHAMFGLKLSLIHI